MSIQPMQPDRDHLGHWTHPDFPVNEEWTQALTLNWLLQNNMVLKVMSLEDDNAAISERYATGDANVSDWNPAQPEGDWFLLSIHDSEDGPMCIWGQHKHR
ncbi:hypothetical protein FE392_18035 [Xenorhabdus sp. 12]|uniref:Uncharacterized protein n=1 Tax=Xenorhabdus santafensis TaxID=2582833 RepID=A0ABU4SEN9_9GAMM|nr:hypothetical protein [Xenorhabdus sp. 12]MDX7989186.1 hypothetical protein [Xenorhabdus sp. 12]